MPTPDSSQHDGEAQALDADGSTGAEVELKPNSEGVGIGSLGAGIVRTDFGVLKGASSIVSAGLKQRDIGGEAMCAMTAQLGIANHMRNMFEPLAASAMFKQYQLADLVTPHALRSI